MMTWYEKQTEECGYTPKCCSCKWLSPLAHWEQPENKNIYGWCVNPIQNKGLKAKQHQVEWGWTCFQHVWRYAEDHQMRFDEMEVQI